MREVSEAERQKMLKICENQYVMSLNSLKETKKKLKEKYNPDGTRQYSDGEIENVDSVVLIRDGLSDIEEQYYGMGGDVEKLKKLSESGKNAVSSVKNIVDKDIFSKVLEISKDDKPDTVTVKEERNTVPEIPQANTQYIPASNQIDEMSYDIIPLPSKGECYKSKIGTLPVAYLTAYDENVIINPNLYALNLVIDTLLKRKILNTNIDPDDLLEGDRDAIILFLRTSGYGNEYPLKVKDSEFNTEFRTTIDLSKLKYKPFTLKSDENGWFDFHLPVTGKNIKFRFLTHRDNVTLSKLEDAEVPIIKKSRIEGMAKDLKLIVENDDTLTKERQTSLRQVVNELENWVEDDMEDVVSLPYTHRVSNELEYSIMAIDGDTDRTKIHEFVKNMPIKDSTELRRYISKNIPGIDYELTIEKPESLGGGSMKVFPQFDQLIFLNRTE